MGNLHFSCIDYPDEILLKNITPHSYSLSPEKRIFHDHKVVIWYDLPKIMQRQRRII